VLPNTDEYGRVRTNTDEFERIRTYTDEHGRIAHTRTQQITTLPATIQSWEDEAKRRDPRAVEAEGVDASVTEWRGRQ
jgi:hypothetical protein